LKLLVDIAGWLPVEIATTLVYHKIMRNKLEEI
jgi:hypothetical protein